MAEIVYDNGVDVVKYEVETVETPTDPLISHRCKEEAHGFSRGRNPTIDSANYGR